MNCLQCSYENKEQLKKFGYCKSSCNHKTINPDIVKKMYEQEVNHRQMSNMTPIKYSELKQFAPLHCDVINHNNIFSFASTANTSVQNLNRGDRNPTC